MPIRRATAAITLIAALTATAHAQDTTDDTAPEGPAEAAAVPTAQPTGTATEPTRPPATRYLLAHLDVIRLNPLGLESQNRLMIQQRLIDADSLLFGNTFWAGGLGLKLNPAFVKIGPVVELQPIAILHLRLAYEYMQFFGTFDYVQSYPEPTEADGFADDNRADNGDAAYVTGGHHAYIEPTVQLKLGPVAVRSKFAFEWWDMSLENRDRVWYDATLDTYVPGDGYVITNDTDLLYLAGDLVLGARLSWVNPIYDDDHFVLGEPEDFEGMSHLRVGPLAAYTISATPGEKPSSHRVLLNVSWYLDHPNREGAMPYILAGYAYDTDL